MLLLREVIGGCIDCVRRGLREKNERKNERHGIWLRLNDSTDNGWKINCLFSWIVYKYRVLISIVVIIPW